MAIQPSVLDDPSETISTSLLLESRFFVAGSAKGTTRVAGQASSAVAFGGRANPMERARQERVKDRSVIMP